MRERWKKVMLAAAAAAAALWMPAAAGAADYRESYTVPEAVRTIVVTPDASSASADRLHIQDALAEAQDTNGYLKVVLKGDFHTNGSLHFYSDTIIDAREATITRSYGGSAATSSSLLNNLPAEEERGAVGGYDMTHNVWILGGVWDGGDLSKASTSGNSFNIVHASDIYMIGTTVRNNFRSHLMELTAVKDMLIQDCSFSGFRPPNDDKYHGSPDHSIAVQIEVAKAGAEEHSSTGIKLDNTICSNIRIIACEFNKSDNGYEYFDNCVGSNSEYVSSGLYQKNIKFLGNLFYRSGNTGQGIYLCGYENATVKGNVVRQSGRKNIYVKKSRGASFVINDNVLSGSSTSGIVIDSSSSVAEINGNTIQNARECGIKVTGNSTVASASNNKISGCGTYGIQASGGGKISSAKNNVLSGNKKGGTNGNVKASGSKGSSKKTSAKKNNKKSSVSKLTSSVKSATIGVGENLKLKITVKPKSASVSYASSNDAVASVSQKGAVTGRSAGRATITISAGTKKAKVNITVGNAPSAFSIVSGKKAVASLTLKRGKSAVLKTNLSSLGEASYKLTWKSGNKKIVTVDAKGKIKAKKKGTARITVTTYNGKKAAVSVTVK